MNAILSKTEGLFRIMFETLDGRAMYALPFENWLTARVTLDHIEDSTIIDSIKDLTGEHKKHGYSPVKGVDID